MVHVIPASNWADALPDVIKKAADGDTIQCRSDAMKQVAIRGQSRICPDKKLTYTVVSSALDDYLRRVD